MARGPRRQGVRGPSGQGAKESVLRVDEASPRACKPVFWELGSQGWVFRVFCNYFPFVLP